MTREVAPVRDIDGARVLVKLGDSVTTDHVSPAGAIPVHTPAGAYLTSLGVERFQLNTYASRRGNHEVMMRGCFANVRLRNQLVPGTEGGLTRNFLTDEVVSVYDAAMGYRDSGTPLVVIAGKDYGSGSSRDWAAKGPALLGVRAVLAESFERIHRSNLIGMGILPLQFLPGESAESPSASPVLKPSPSPASPHSTRVACQRRSMSVPTMSPSEVHVRLDTERDVDYHTAMGASRST